ncbi:transposase [Oceanobacillus sp. FSL K6-3682]|uniref:transposase n=1 Tax=Oceanobacillus sp. FSL K6-3682 TaxID=2921503 RepID=UPI0030DD71E8
MKSNTVHTTDELLNYIQLFNAGCSYDELKRTHGLLLSNNKFRRCHQKYMLHGLKGLQQRKTNHSYSADFKQTVVQEYLNGQIGKGALAIKYNIPSETTVRNWILKYTEGKENATYSPSSEVYTMESKKITFEERLEIVQYVVIDHQLSYKKAAEQFNVRYNNVYQWVNKYKTHGPEGLQDGRGKKKQSEPESEDARLRAENDALKAQNQYLKTGISS